MADFIPAIRTRTDFKVIRPSIGLEIWPVSDRAVKELGNIDFQMFIDLDAFKRRRQELLDKGFTFEENNGRY